MNDFDAAAKKIGNRFDLVLVASERLRELHQQRRESPELAAGGRPPHWRAINDVELGIVDRSYLDKLKDRSRRRRKFDPLS